MSSDLYTKLYEATKARYADLSPQAQQEKTNEIGKVLKENSKTLEDRRTNTEQKIKSLKEATSARKAASTYFFAQVSIIILHYF